MNNLFYHFIKRFIDIIFGVIGCILLIPILIIVKIAYLIDKDTAPIFYKQRRIGQYGKEFNMYKIRSMVVNADEELIRLMKENPKIKAEYEANKKLVDDPRITKVGQIIRRYSIDETTQFLNVLIGNMSLIGNRPYLVREKRYMGKYFDQIVATKPGITGLWQTAGHNDVSFKSRLELEATYSEIASLDIDFKIFIRTFRAIALGKEGV